MSGQQADAFYVTAGGNLYQPLCFIQLKHKQLFSFSVLHNNKQSALCFLADIAAVRNKPDGLTGVVELAGGDHSVGWPSDLFCA